MRKLQREEKVLKKTHLRSFLTQVRLLKFASKSEPLTRKKKTKQGKGD